MIKAPVSSGRNGFIICSGSFAGGVVVNPFLYKKLVRLFIIYKRLDRLFVHTKSGTDFYIITKKNPSDFLYEEKIGPTICINKKKSVRFFVVVRTPVLNPGSTLGCVLHHNGGIYSPLRNFGAFKQPIRFSV